MSYVQEGKTIDYTPDQDVAAGEVVVMTNLVGVALRPIKAGETGSVAVEGVFTLPTEEPSDTAHTLGKAMQYVFGDKWLTGYNQTDIDAGDAVFIGHIVRLYPVEKVDVRLCQAARK